MSASKLLCRADQKAELEARNALAQLDYLRYLVEELHVKNIRSSHVRDLQALAVKDIYPCGGQYRDARFTVRIPDSGHEPPPASAVSIYVEELLDVLNDTDKQVHYRAAFALWRFNWIHPFPGGNGRTARALTYLVLCIDFGSMLPGVPTMPSIIAESRDEYLDALRSADRKARGTSNTTEAAFSVPIFRQMVLFVTKAAMKQLVTSLPGQRAVGRVVRVAARFIALVRNFRDHH